MERWLEPTAPVSPQIVAIGPMNLYCVENLTTGHKILMDISLSDGELLVIDTKDGTVTSTLHGNMAQKVLIGSDILSFRLVP